MSDYHTNGSKLREEHRPTALALLAESLQDQSGWEAVKLEWRHREGHFLTLLGTAVPLVDPRGRISGYRGTRRRAPADLESRRRRALISQRVRVALDRRRPQVALQPIVSLNTCSLTGAEALCRFPDLRPPDVWFAEAHEVGEGLDLEL